MPLMKLDFKPGINRDSTRYANTGGWWDCDNVRFRLGKPEQIGGWEKLTSASFLGNCRTMIEWSNLAGDVDVGMGTNLKAYIMRGSAFYDITPIRKTTNPMANNPFTSDTATNSGGFTTITVTDNSHGAVTGSSVIFSGATTFNSIPAASLNTELIITVLTGNTYTVTVAGTASASSAGGGAAVVATYLLNISTDTTTTGSGWGAGPWGGEYFGVATNTGWGAAAATTISSTQIGLWSMANYGEDLLYCQRNGPMYYWDETLGLATRGTALSTQSGAISVPLMATEVAVSNERHAIAFGTNALGDTVQDKMLVRWASRENPVDWLPTAQNSAGDLRLIMGSQFITHAVTSQEILIWTNAALHSMRYVGVPYVYGIDVIAPKASIVGPKAKVLVNDSCYWMGRGKFYDFSGRVNPLVCTLEDYVFTDINYDQLYKVYAGSNMTFNEVMWFYPSANSQEVDRVVIYNYQDKIWYKGSMSRTAWLDRVSQDHPIGASGGYLYSHETTNTDGSTNPVSAINSYIESSPIELGNGDQFMFVSRIIPDITFRGSESGTGCYVTMNLIPQDWPGGSLGTTVVNEVDMGTTVTVEEYTNRVDLRLRARSVAIKITNDWTGVGWRLGEPRIEARPDGRKT